MTLKTNRTPFLCCLKLYASFGSNQWIQTGVTVRKCRISVKIGDFLSCVTLKFDRWLWKTIGQLFYAPSSCMHHFVGICEFKLEWWSGNVHNFTLTSVSFTFNLWPWPLARTSHLPMVITPETFRVIPWMEHCQKGVTDGRTDRQIDRWKEVFLELLGRS